MIENLKRRASEEQRCLERDQVRRKGGKFLYFVLVSFFFFSLNCLGCQKLQKLFKVNFDF